MAKYEQLHLGGALESVRRDEEPEKGAYNGVEWREEQRGLLHG